jgi:hypothetical protein
MALTAKLYADFGNFYDAVQKAEVVLKSFEEESHKVEDSLNRMVDKFSGRKLVADATLMVEAVERIGGVSKLTQDELGRVSAKAAEAAEKLRAMGQDVPPGLQKIADAAGNAKVAHEGLGSVVRSVATDFLAMFTVRAAFNFVKDIIEDASALKALSQQTHISVEELQVLAGGMSEFGVDAETLGQGLFKLSRGIAGGDDSVAHGLHLMGLSLKDVQGLNGRDLFLKVAEGLSTLQGGLRDTAAAEIYGGKLGAAMAGASEGIEAAIAAWEKLNTVASTESVNAMDEFGSSINRAGANLKALAANMIGPAAQGFNVLYDAASKGASKWGLLGAMWTDMVTKNVGLGTGTENLTRILLAQQPVIDLTAVKQAALAASHGEVTKAVDTRTQAEKALAALEADATATLTPTQIAHLERLKEIGQLTAKNAELVGVNAAQYAKYTADVAASDKMQKEFGETLKAVAKIEEDNRGKRQAGLLGLDKAEQDSWQKKMEGWVKADDAILAAEEKLRDAQQRATLSTTDYQIAKINERAAKEIAALEGTQEQVARHSAVITAQAAKDIKDITDAASKAIDVLVKKGMDAYAVLEAAGRQAKAGMAVDVVGNAQAAGLARTGMQSPIYVAPPIFARAAGGPVSSGQPYMVGERGPELFVPNANGGIVPNGRATIVQNITQYINGTAQDVAKKVSDEIMRSAMRGQQFGAS